MEDVRKRYKDQLKPTAEREIVLAETLWRRRQLYHAGLEQRLDAYRQCGVTVSRYRQEAERQDLRASLPEYAALHRHVVQDVLARLDTA